ncbi:MAG: hypothetical protein EON58_20560 [Alphaproteobacteria bacterium]|nr:MAG: hypothetical protein EON58_20560 [Alphaproteobacteria bacterium]
MSHQSSEREFLRYGVLKLRPILAPAGFMYFSGEVAVSSGGPFATATFRRRNLEIGLIVRDRDSLGCPSYFEGDGYAGHSDLIEALGMKGKAHLVPGDQVAYRSADGGDPFDALLADLQEVILPALERSHAAFSSAIVRAHAKWLDQLHGYTA